MSVACGAGLRDSALVGLIVNEPHSAAVARWYAGSQDELASAAWCVPEFASSLGIKQRTGQMDATQAQQAWDRFERLAANDLWLLSVALADFHRAAVMTWDAAQSLRAGDALHLACAERSGAKSMATLDDVMARNAQRLKLKPVKFS
jgi:predicted nucleic acid-binding protein